MKKKIIGVGALIVAIGIGWLYYNSYNVEKPLDLEGISVDFFPQPISTHTQRPMIVINGADVARMTQSQQRDFIVAEVEEMRHRTLYASLEDQTLTTTLGSLGMNLEEDLEITLTNIAHLYKQLFEVGNSSTLRLPVAYQLEYTHQSEKISQWVQGVSEQLNVSPAEPTLKMNGRGNFEMVSGRVGMQVLIDQLVHDVETLLKEVPDDELTVEIFTEPVQPKRDESLLKLVDTMISSATSTFPRNQVERSKNLDLSTERISGTLLMPGEEFSFTKLVAPVTQSNGYFYATVFKEGEVADGMGGGICQVSSTIYWATLRAGILPSERRAHSRAVFYVPLGLDATMWEGYIDYRFVNPYDYPIYLNTYTTSSGVLNIEFWSSSKALNGLTFEPRTVFVESGERTETYDTFLRTYGNGKLVSEKYLHRSTYIVD